MKDPTPFTVKKLREIAELEFQLFKKIEERRTRELTAFQRSALDWQINQLQDRYSKICI
jgi:hypothetical protein